MKKIRLLALSLVPLLGLFFGFSAPQKEADPAGVKDFLAGCRLLDKVAHGNLTVIPVQCPASGIEDIAVSTLDEIMPGGRLVIREVSEAGAVNTLVLKNESDRYVFIMAGEILAGAKQDRILQQDVILPPHSREIAVPVFCVEHGRWAIQGDRFSSQKMNAPISVRQEARLSESQSKVWEEVSRNNYALAAETETGTLAATYKSDKLAKESGRYRDALSGLPERYPKATGVVVLVSGKVMVADLFGRRHIFKALWKKLLDSYVAEAVRRSGEKVPSEIGSADAFLDMAQSARIGLAPSPGAGSRIEVSSSKVKGSGVVLTGDPFHLDIFPVVPDLVPEGIQRPYFRR